jgi:oligopeptide transport system substrate-binding protein
MAMLVLLYSCSRQDRNDPRVFYYNQPEGIATLDPAYAKSQPVMWAVHQLYSTLLEVDTALHIVPSVARRWEVSKDRLTYTFYLRGDVYFHDNAVFPGGRGRRLAASDVVYSLSRIMDRSVASPGAWIFNGRVDTIQPFLAVSDTVFQLRLLHPFHPILGILTMPYCSLLPKEAVDKYGTDFRRNPVGSGPFAFSAWEEGQALIFRKHPRYFEKDGEGRSLPYLEAVKISFLDSKSSEFLAFRQGRLDFVNDIDANFKDEILTRGGELKKEWEGRIVLQKHPYLNTEYLGIQVDSSGGEDSPLKKRLVRQAMNHAIDRRKMMLYLRNSIGTPAENGFVPEGLPGFTDHPVRGYDYDPDKARTLLASAGFPGGRGLPVTRLLTIPIYAELGAFVARQLEEVGIPVRVEAVQRGTLLEMTAKGQAPFFRASWIADYPDAENYLSVFYGPNPAPPNYTRYQRAAFDSLYRAAVQETDDSLRQSIYVRMDQMVTDDAPVIPLWYDMVIHLVSPRVRGFYANALNLTDLRRVRKLGN